MNIIRDAGCTAETPVRYGHADTSVYGIGTPIRPRIPGKRDTDYSRRIYLSELLPLEEYDLIIVLFSGGKDSAAAYFRLRELGVPASKIELWHHDIDGGHPERRMDWPVTLPYVRAFAGAENVRLRVSWRANGFFGELRRVGASMPIVYEGDSGLETCHLSDEQTDSARIRLLEEPTAADLDKLKSYGKRLKFPAKSGNLRHRWCSAYLKIDVASAVIRNLVRIRANAKLLLVSGERRGESAGRSRYNEMELHATHAPAKAHRTVHHWRPVIDYTLRDVWEVCRRHKLTPHPCYACGWNRCSCMTCIFSLPSHWAGIRELFPNEYAALRHDELRIGFTIDNQKPLDEYVGDAASCVCHTDTAAIEWLLTGQFPQTGVYTSNWRFPAGAFRDSAGEPC